MGEVLHSLTTSLQGQIWEQCCLASFPPLQGQAVKMRLIMCWQGAHNVGQRQLYWSTPVPLIEQRQLYWPTPDPFEGKLNGDIKTLKTNCCFLNLACLLVVFSSKHVKPVHRSSNRLLLLQKQFSLRLKVLTEEGEEEAPAADEERRVR